MNSIYSLLFMQFCKMAILDFFNKSLELSPMNTLKVKQMKDALALTFSDIPDMPLNAVANSNPTAAATLLPSGTLQVVALDIFGFKKIHVDYTILELFEQFHPAMSSDKKLVSDLGTIQFEDIKTLETFVSYIFLLCTNYVLASNECKQALANETDGACTLDTVKDLNGGMIEYSVTSGELAKFKVLTSIEFIKSTQKLAISTTLFKNNGLNGYSKKYSAVTEFVC